MTALVQTGPSPATEISGGLDEISKRLSLICFIVGTIAVIFGFMGICISKLQRCGCTLVFGIMSFLLAVTFILTSVMVLTLYFVTEEQVIDFCSEKISTLDLNGLSKTIVDDVNSYI